VARRAVKGVEINKKKGKKAHNYTGGKIIRKGGWTGVRDDLRQVWRMPAKLRREWGEILFGTPLEGREEGRGDVGEVGKGLTGKNLDNAGT